jgi:predicted HTH domain antitoxin
MSVGHGESTITIELPEEGLAPIAETPEAFAKEMRLAAAMLWYTQGRVSPERAAQYAGLSRMGFLDALAAANLPAFDLDVEEEKETISGATPVTRDREETVVNKPTEPSMASQESGADTPFTPETAEAHYQPLGRLKGVLATRNVQDEARAFWQSAGERGARWLACRLRYEVHLESLHAVGSQLADLGWVAVAPIVEELGKNPAPDQAWALLQALGWMGKAASAPTIEEASIELLLAKFLQDRDPDVREAAAHAMRRLPPERATYWLRRREQEETDQEVIQTIEDELTRIRTAGG